MSRSDDELMESARKALTGKWQEAALATLVYLVINIIASSVPKIGPLVGIVIGGPMTLGYVLMIFAMKRGGNVKVGQVFDGFSRFVDALVANLLITIFVLLWSLLLIVPGIIAALGYSMTFFLLADNPSMDGMEAVRRSKQLMNGHKTRLFVLGLRFLGWVLLAILTFGVGFIWLIPYIWTTFAAFYDDIREVKVIGETNAAA